MKSFLFAVGFLSVLSLPLWAQAPSQVTTYDKLLSAIRKVRHQTEARIEAAVEAEKVREAWETGKLIHEHILLNKERAEYGKQVIERLAADLGMSERELNYTVEFARTYPIARPAAQLSWSHYQTILALNDPKEREEVASEAVRQNWNRDQVRDEVRRRNSSSPVTRHVSLEDVKPGAPNTYQIFKQGNRLKMDLGFDISFDVPEKFQKKVKEGDTVTFGSKKITPAAAGDLYTYHARVIEVVDGDTFYAVIDLGFGVSLYQRLRLRRLDAPEILSAEGKKAKAVLEKTLSENILIKTVKSDDQYGRYLADVWVHQKPIESSLLDSGVFEIRGDA